MYSLPYTSMYDQSFMAPMSAPAAKAFSLPVMTTAPMSASASKASSAAPSSFIS